MRQAQQGRTAVPRRASRRDAGFTLIELLIVVAVTAVGFVALLTLQTAQIGALTQTTKATAATNLAWHVLDTLKLESVQWDGSVASLNSLPLLSRILSDEGKWRRLPCAEALGDDVFHDRAGCDDSPGAPTYAGWDQGLVREFPKTGNARFCVHYKLGWLDATQTAMQAGVRVFWLQEGTNEVPWRSCPDDMGELENRARGVRYIELPPAGAGGAELPAILRPFGEGK